MRSNQLEEVRLRKIMIATAALALAGPAAAQVYSGPVYQDETDTEVVRTLPHPAEVEALGHVVASVLDALLKIDIAPLADAIDPYARRGGARTLGDLASRDDPHYRERMRDSVDDVATGLGAMARQMHVLAPALHRSLEEIERSIEDTARDLPLDSD